MNDNEISLNEVVIDVDNNIDIKTEVDISLTTTEPIEIYIEPREYKIIGDDIYIPISYESSPQWLQNTINTLTNVKVDDVVTNLNDLINQLTYAVGQVELAKNRYEQSITSLNDTDSRFNSLLTTINSNMDGLDASLKDLIATKVTSTQASVVALEAITTSMNDTSTGSTLGSTLLNLKTSITNLNTSVNTSLTSLESSINGAVDANAQAVEVISTYVGIDSNGGVTGTGLLADVEILQKQNDGVINTFTGVYDVIEGVENPNNNTDNDRLLTNVEPYSLWIAQDLANGNNDTRTAHIGDVYIKYNLNGNGTKEYIASFKFIRTIPDSTSPYSTDSEGFTWAVIIDQAAQDAYVAALNAWDLADDKRTVFGGNVVPTGAVERDLWIPSANVSSYIKGEIYQYISGAWSPTTRYTADIQTLTSNVQAQIDSKVDTYYQDTVPFANATNVARKTQAGDYWYCTLTAGSYIKGKMYKYVETANGSNWNYTWTETADVTKYAFDIADGKASIFTTSAQPSSYKINDMLIVTTASFSNSTTTFSTGVVLTSNATRTTGFVAADWVKKINDTESLNGFINATYTPMVSSLQNQIDGKIESWYTSSTSDPKTAWTTADVRLQHNGDMWYQTDTKKSYWYSNTTHSWNLIEDQTAITALANAATAQATADGVVVSFYAIKQDTAPATTSMWLNKSGTKVLKEYKTSWVNVSVQTGDTLMAYDPVTKDMSTYVYNGSGWITNTENGMVAESKAITNLTASLNTTNGEVGGHTTQLSTVDTRIANGVASVETKWAYNSNVNINGVWKKSGFGLSTNYTSGSGTLADPYVSEFWIDASRFKFTNSNQTGQVAPFTIDATGANPQIAFNGKVTFSNVTNTTGTGSNLLYNSAPKIGSETKGWYVWTNSGMTVNLSAGFDVWKPTGGASVAANIGGSPSIGSVFDVGQSLKFPVIAGSRYEASAYISAHRSNSYVFLVFYDTSGNYAGEAQGNVINYAGSNALVNWGRSSVFTTAPANAATALLIIRSTVTGSNPYCFVANAFAGVAEANQTTPSNWSEGTSAGATYTSELSNDAGFTTLGAVASQGYVLPAGVANAINTNTTTINGGKITTGSITAKQIQASSISADRLLSSNGVSTVWNGGGLVSANFNGNVSGNIGNPTTGFRLSSNAAGTATDPNIYGAYIKGSTVDIETLSVKAVGYPGNSGRVVKYQKNGYIQMPGYGSGFLASRVCSQSDSAVKVEGWYRAATNYLVAYLQYSTDGINWNNLEVKYAQQYGYQEYFYIYFAELFNPSLVTATSQVTFRIVGNVGGSASDILISIYNN